MRETREKANQERKFEGVHEFLFLNRFLVKTIDIEVNVRRLDTRVKVGWNMHIYIICAMENDHYVT